MLNRSRLTRFFIPCLSLVLLTGLLLPLVSGCARTRGEGRDGGLFALLRARDADFTLVFPSETNLGDEVVCAGERRGERVVFTVISPERSAGASVTLLLPSGDRTDFSVSLSGPGFPAPAAVDPAAARFLTDLASLLYLPPEDGASAVSEAASVRAEPSPVRVSLFVPAIRRGEGDTLLRSDCHGVLALTPEGIPVYAECADLGGNRRLIRFSEYAFSEDADTLAP